MTTIVIKIASDNRQVHCGLCARKYARAKGPELFLANSGRGVCHTCGKNHAPKLAALIDLARAAELIGPLSCLTRWLPLAQAAHHYFSHEREAA